MTTNSKKNLTKSQIELLKKDDIRTMLETSLLNTYNFFDQDIRKQRGSKLLAYDQMRAASPNSAMKLRIDRKLGGKPKKNEMYRDGHYPKFSEMIDKIEKIAL